MGVVTSLGALAGLVFAVVLFNPLIVVLGVLVGARAVSLTRVARSRRISG